MSTVTTDIEVVSPFPIEMIFHVFSDFDTVAPKVNPQVFKSIETLEGDGGVGTIKLFTFGDDVPFASGKYKIDAIDVSNFSFSVKFFEGDILMDIMESITHHVKILPSADAGSVFMQTIVYNCKGNDKPSKEALNFEKEIYEKPYKALEAYAIAHPETY
ncbi:root allergen protein-like [Rutidosis leptorrhynchoides]|uniref:root allergen protein-like n=1 Tax=Rutidosis leptorrhynchoides TaxID=125765 RepID=UPI003A9A5E39